MTVHVDGEVIRLESRCRLEDTEVLLSALQRFPDYPVNVSSAETLHTAIVQLLLASGRSIEGNWCNPLLGKCFKRLENGAG